MTGEEEIGRLIRFRDGRQEIDLSWVKFTEDHGPDNCHGIGPTVPCAKEAVSLVLWHKQCGCGRGPGVLYCYDHITIIRIAVDSKIPNRPFPYIVCPGCSQVLRFIREDRLHP